MGQPINWSDFFKEGFGEYGQNSFLEAFYESINIVRGDRYEIRWKDKTDRWVDGERKTLKENPYKHNLRRVRPKDAPSREAAERLIVYNLLYRRITSK